MTAQVLAAHKWYIPSPSLCIPGRQICDEFVHI